LLIVFALAGDSTITNDLAMISFVTPDHASGRASRAVCVLLATVSLSGVFLSSSAS
jgi:hypothetical protein